MPADGLTYLLNQFHEDWTDDFGSWEELIDDFVAHDREVAETVPEELKFFLLVCDEEGLHQLMVKNHAPWDFSVLYGTHRAWFTAVLEHLEQALAKR